MADAKTTTKNAESTGSAKTDEVWEAPPEKVRTLDSKDYDRGWTVQASSRPGPPEEMNPVTFSKDQLPHPDVMKEQGVNLQSYLAHFGNVEGATVSEGVLVDEDSGDPLSTTLPDKSDEVVDDTTPTNPTAVSKRSTAKKS